MMPNRSALDVTTYSTTTEKRGSIDAMTVLTIRVMLRNILSSYSYMPSPRSAETGRCMIESARIVYRYGTADL